MTIVYSKKNNRRIIEYPDLPEGSGLEFGEAVQVEFERTVVDDDFFGSGLPAGRILVQHACWYRPLLKPTAVKAHLVLARVAGYRSAVYGLPETVVPVLFEHPDDPDTMIAVTPILNYEKSRFMPKADWKIVIGRLMAWLEGKEGITDIDWKEAAGPVHARGVTLPNDYEKIAFDRSSEWFNRNIFFNFDGRLGVFEGFVSQIEPNGRQSPRPKTRGDCSGEAAMIPALDWALNKNPGGRKLSGQIMHNLFNGPELADRNPKSPTYGGVRFYEYVDAYYGDDNCRAALGCILASELIDSQEHIADILRCLFSILRTTSPQGFRPSALRHPKDFADGKNWCYYGTEEYIEFRPHYQAYMWAGFLQAYRLTGHADFLKKSKEGISRLMAVFPRVYWSNGITEEYARMLLPLAFLIQIEDTPKHRGWLRTVTEQLLQMQHDSGTVLERMGDISMGKYPSPRSNEEYGVSEASLIQEDGDPACDLLYSVPYAFLGLHEAFIATGESFYKDAGDRMADFLARIQVCSQQESYLDGCWMRGFDVELWEYFGSSADIGWGAWCVESGWTNTWIATTFALRQMKRGLFCQNISPVYKEKLPEIVEEMSILHEWSPNDKFAQSLIAPGAE